MDKYEIYKNKQKARLAERIEREKNRRKARMEGTLWWAIKEVKREARMDTWCTSHADCFRCSLGGDSKQAESEDHINKKFERWKYWRRQGATVFTELIWANGAGRSDLVICLPSGEVFIEEIIQTESESSINLKEQKYPFPVKVVKC